MAELFQMAQYRDLKTIAASASTGQDHDETLHDGGGGGTSGGMNDDWKDSVDRQLGQLHGDVRALLYGLIACFVFLIGSLGTAAVYFNDKSETKAERVDERFATVQQQLSEIKLEQAKTSAKLDLLVERQATPKH